jgi:hypothetical protein
MYKLIHIINDHNLDNTILNIWNLNNPGIEASCIIRNKGYFDIYTSYQFEFSSTNRISFAQALTLLNKSIDLENLYQQAIKNIYSNRGRILNKFFQECNKSDGLLEAINLIKNLK